MEEARPRRSRSALLAFLALVLGCAGGCVHWDVGSTMPSAPDLAQPPYPLDRRGLHGETDPREDVLMLSGGPAASASVGSVESEDKGVATLGGEVSVHWARGVPGHRRDAQDLLRFPEQTWALNLGWTSTFLRRAGGGTFRHDEVYLELQRTSRIFHIPAGFAAGPVLRLGNDLGGGAQLTAFAGPFYGRATFVERDAIVSVGVMAKFPVAWVWRRAP